jgi:hypothetical protein
MRVAAEAKVLDTEGSLEAHRTTIASSRKTIRMMIDGMYADKELAVARELATNASDSHRRAGRTDAFYIHCPTLLKPEFFVRDYGVGMTHEKVIGTYIVLGESDKDTSDDEAGMWGIGALAPFSKSDQYYITCYDGETARHYGFGIAEDGVPTLHLMAEEACQEPRGVRVGFSAEEKDFAKFEAAIQKIALGFGSQLETNIALKGAGEVAFKGDDWTAYTNCPLGARWNVRQGGVVYPIDPHKLNAPHDHKLTFVIDCPIGSVKMTPSRESVAYTDEVVAYLVDRVAQAADDVRLSVIEQVKGVESAVEFFEKLKKIKPSFLTCSFVHEPTGLTGPSILAVAPQVFFSAIKDSNGRWTFSTLAQLNLMDHIKFGSAYMIADVTPYLDPSREEVTRGREWLTNSEVRRLSRLTRAFLDAQKLEHGLFLFNTDYSEGFWKATLPEMKRKPLSLEEVRSAIPRRVAPPSPNRPPLKGIALAKAAGEQRPVFEIAERAQGETVAWVSSDQYRKAAGPLFKLARRFGLVGLYIVAPGATAHMSDNGVLPLREALEGLLAKQGVSFTHWYASRNSTDHYSTKNLLDFLGRLMKADAEAYETLARTRGRLGGIARSLRKVSTATLLEMSEEERKACTALLVDADGKAIEVEPPEEIMTLRSAAKEFSDNYGHPVVKFFDHVATMKTTDQIRRAAKAVIHIEKLFPLTERLRGY